MSLKVAIQAKNEKDIKAIVDDAVKIVKADAVAQVEAETGVNMPAKPGEAQVNTVFGDVPFTLVFDADTKWHVITQAYVDAVQEVSGLSSKLTDAEAKVETAKIIAGSEVLRSVGDTSTSADKSGLL